MSVTAITQSGGRYSFQGTTPPEPVPEIIEDTLPKCGVAVLAGQSGAGKTFVLTELAVCLASGRPFFGRKVKEPTGVILFLGEGQASVELRLAAAMRHHGINDRLPIAYVRAAPDFATEKGRREAFGIVVEACEDMGQNFGVYGGVVAIDTVASTCSLKDENDNAEVAGLLNRLAAFSRQTSTLVLPVHHFGKNQEAGARGGAAWRGNCDAMLSVICDRNEIRGTVKSRALCQAKHRDGEEGPIADFELVRVPLGTDQDGKEFASLAVQPDLGRPATETRPKLNQRQRLAVRILADVALEVGKPLPSAWKMPSGLTGVPEDEWRKALLSRGAIDPAGSNVRRDYWRLKTSLLSSFAISVQDGIVWLVSTA